MLEPAESLTFLGFVLNSVNMTVKLTPGKIEHIKGKCCSLMRSKTIFIHDLPEVIGVSVSSFPGVLHGPLFYRCLEIDKTAALREHKGKFAATMQLSSSSLQELQWWLDNLGNVEFPTCVPNSKLDIILYTDASNMVAVMGTEKTGGRWNEVEATHHIDVLDYMD